MRPIWLRAGLIAIAAGFASAASAAPYDLWTESCLQPAPDADAVRRELAAAIDTPAQADLPALVCKALSIFDTERWQQQWQAWNAATDDAGCGKPEQLREWRVELFLSPYVHQVALRCAQSAGNAQAAAAASQVLDGVMEAYLTRTGGQTFDQGVPLMMPADVLAYAELLDGQVMAFWAKPYQRGTRIIFKVMMAQSAGRPQQIHYFEWALPIWATLKAPPDTTESGPWVAQQSGVAFAQGARSGPLEGAARIYAAYNEGAAAQASAGLLGRVRDVLRPSVQQGDLAAMFELAQYEMELPDGEMKAAIDLLLALADAGDGRAIATLAVPTLLHLGGLEGGEEAAQQLLERAAKKLHPGEAQFYAASQIQWVGSEQSNDWAKRWLAAAAEQGHGEATYLLGMQQIRDDQQALARGTLERAAAKHVSAIAPLVELIGPTEPAARDWIAQSAHWSPLAMRQLAEQSSGEEAERLWLRAALAGDPQAAVRQARRLLAQDSAIADTAAQRWATWAMRGGVPVAVALAMTVDLRARGEHADPARGKRMLELIRSKHYPLDADQTPEAWFEVARAEESGQVLEANRARALRSYKALAQREYAPALLRLAEIESGASVSKARSRRVAKLLERAHAAGAAAAAPRLAALYADPKQRIADPTEAARWAAIVAARESPATDAAAEKRD